MEMNDQILTHVMNVQTQLLQQMIRLEQDRNSNNITQPATTISPDTGSFGTPMPSSVASPVTPPPLPGMAQLGTPFMSVNDPTRYGTYAAPNQGYWSRQNQAAQSGFRNFIGGSINEMRNFDPTHESKESIEQYFAHQSRGVQEQTVGILGGAISGAATVGSFFIPGGLAASLAVGGVIGGGVGFATEAMVSGAKTSLDYQDLLQKQSYKFINAFESTSDMGGIGMGLRERQNISGYLRDLADDKFLKSDEMMTILDGAASNNLLKSVSDVDSFKKKFTEIVDTVKSIAVTMNQSLEEATKFMGEMEQRGISTKDMGLISAQAKVVSSFLGVDANQGAQLLMQTSDNIVQGTSLDPTKIVGSASQSIFAATQILEESQKNDPALYHYIKNSGGDSAVGSQYEQLSRGYVNQGQGKSMMLGLFSSGFKLNQDTGDFEVDEKAMDQLLNGNLSRQQMQSLSDNAKNGLSDAQLFKLSETAGTKFNEYANSTQVAEFMKRNVDMLMEQQASLGHPIDEETALQHLGMASDSEQAKLMEEMIEKQTDPRYVKMLQSRAFKEEQDSAMISESPGIIKRFGFWVNRNFKNPLGDAGQGISDGIGRGMQDYQKFLTGIDDNSVLGGLDDSLATFDEKGLNKVLKQSERLIDNKPIGSNQGNLINETLDQGTYETLMSQIQQGQLDPADLPRILENSKGVMSNWRAERLRKEATGEYDGFLGGVNYYTEGALMGASNLAGKWLGYDHNDMVDDLEGATSKTMDDLKDKQKSIMKKKKNLNQDLTALITDGTLGTTDPDELRKIKEAIKKGDLSDVRSLTGNNRTAVNLADKYMDVNKDSKDYGKDMEDFDNLSEYTVSMTQAGSQLARLFKASKVLDKTEVDSMFGDLMDRSKEKRDLIAKGKLSASGMGQFDKDTLNQLNDVFEMMPESDLKKLAKYLEEKDPNAHLLGENGTLNVKQLQNYLMNDVLRGEHITEINKDAASKGKSKDGGTEVAAKAAGDHQEAMYQFLATYQQESQMLRDAVAGRPIRNNKSSSLSYTG